jgi:hypothetical protein
MSEYTIYQQLAINVGASDDGQYVCVMQYEPNGEESEIAISHASLPAFIMALSAHLPEGE